MRATKNKTVPTAMLVWGIQSGLDAEEREGRGQETSDGQREDIQPAARAGGQRIQDQRHADVFAVLERAGQCEKSRCGHEVPGVGVGAWDVQAELAGDDRRQHRHQHADRAHAGQQAGRAVKTI
ncbi:hypothetical protein G6F35_018162 [Rhizopus arrhizus]|nr:hypothetical protein G6F35_018162 [Rhizopus arrhizus]